MKKGMLSRVDVWHLENTLFRLYRIIDSCVELIDPVNEELFESTTATLWIDKDVLITEMCEKPQRNGIGNYENVALSTETMYDLYDFIVENEDISSAIELTKQELNLHSLIVYIRQKNASLCNCLRCVPHLEHLRDFRYEVYKWACFYCDRIGSTIEKETAKRINLSGLIDNCAESNHLKFLPTRESSILVIEDSVEYEEFDLGDYFVRGFDRAKLIKIYKHLSSISCERGDLYVSRMISMIAYAHYAGYLCCSYAKAIRAVLGKFHIEVKPNYLHPATFGQPTIKGRARSAFQEAIEFFDSL